MTRSLAVPLLALALVSLGVSGCVSPGPAPGGKGGSGGSAPGGSGGGGGSAPPAQGGASGAVGGGGSGGGAGGSPASGGTSGTNTDASSGPVGDPKGPDGGTVPANGDWAASCAGVAFKPGITGEQFCAKYQTACGFTGASRYTSAADCMTKYMGLSDGDKGGKACVAWYVCVAGKGEPDTYCPTALGASTATGPCKPAYLMQP